MRCGNDKTARISNVARQVFRRPQEEPRRATTGEAPSRIRDRWPNSSQADLGESPGCYRDGYIRAWRA